MKGTPATQGIKAAKTDTKLAIQRLAKQAVRDALHQAIADAQEQITDASREEALANIERRHDNASANDKTWDAIQCAVHEEIDQAFLRIYEAIKR